MNYETLVFLLTLTAMTMYAVLVWIFFRIPGDRVMKAMGIYFSAMFCVFLIAVIAEGPLDILLHDKWWAEWRPLFFRGSQAVARVWLVIVLATRGK